MSKIIYSLRNIKDRIRANLTVRTQNILFYTALLLIVFLSIFVRISTITSGTNLIKAFDPWIQYYNAEYLSTHSLFEYFNWHDIKSWYPEGYQRANLRPGLTFTVVIIYKVLASLGIPISLYNICFYFPAFMGGLTVLAMYFLGTEVLDRRCGLLAAFFLAFSPGHMGRTVAGFFDNETIGVFAVLMAFFFFLKAIRTGKISFSVLAGLFTGYLALSWGGYMFVYLIIPIVVLILILTKKYNEKIFIAFIGTEGTGLALAALEYNYKFSELFSSIEVGGIVLIMVLLTLFHLIYTKRYEYPKFYNGLINTLKWGIIPGFLIAAVIVWVAPEMVPFGFGKRFQSILSPLVRDQLHLVASVAEHMPSSWSVYYNNILIPMMLIPLGVYFSFKRLEAPEIFLLLFTFTLFYFTGSMIRIVLLFAPAAALMGSYGLAHVLKIFGSFYGEEKSVVRRKRKRQLRGKQTIGNSEVLVVYFIISILCIVQVVHAGNTAVSQLRTSQLSPGDQIHDWEESLTWMKTNLDGTSVVVSWWDYGYWLTPIGNVTTVNDNNTHNSSRIGLTGMGFMQTNELYSAEIFKKLNADYVLVYFGFWTGLGGDEGKWPWMVRICNDHYEKYKEMGLEKDNWAEDSVFKENNYVNTSAGSTVYREDWFQSQLVRLMFYGEPTSTDAASQGSLPYQFAQKVNSEKDDAGNLWVTHIPRNGLYDFKVFEPVYISKNHLVKLYKVDYTALESSFTIKEQNLNTEGYGTFRIHNTGENELQIADVLINGESYDFTMGIGKESQILETEEEKMVWIDTGFGDSEFE
ncbi:MAG: Oligosaccharyl transferase STT3 subunit, partial [Promethearchaeota archaeon]